MLEKKLKGAIKVRLKDLSLEMSENKEILLQKSYNKLINYGQLDI